MWNKENRNCIFQKAEINFSYGNLTWENGRYLVKLLKVTTYIPQKSDYKVEEKSFNLRSKPLKSA